jgi:hypothetical protein
LTAQGHLQEVFLDARFDGLAQLGLDLEEAIGGTQSADALVGPLVVVIFDPDFDALARGIKTFELRAGQELLPDALPEAFDLAQRHGMMRAGFEVRDTVLLQLRLEARSAAPGGVLAAIVGEHLFGRFELGDGLAIHFDHRLRGGAAEQIRADDEARVIIKERDDIRVTATQPESENVRLPHLVGRGPLEETGPREIALFRRRLLRHEPGLVEFGAHRFGTGLEKEHAAQPLSDAFDAERGVLLFELDDFARDGGREFGLAGVRTTGLIVKTLLAQMAIAGHPPIQRAHGDVEFGTDGVAGEALLEEQADGAAFELKGVAPGGLGPAARLPPGGEGCSLLLYGLTAFFIMHANTPFQHGVSTIYPLILVS